MASSRNMGLIIDEENTKYLSIACTTPINNDLIV